MTLDQAASLSQIAGAIGVIASLIFVGLQIRDNSSAVRSATAQAVHDNYASWYISLSNNEAALATSAKGFVDLTALAGRESAVRLHHDGVPVAFAERFPSMEGRAPLKWTLGRLGSVDDEPGQHPGGADFWAERGYVFGSEFQSHVADIMKRKPDPRARAFGVVPVTHVTERVEPSPASK